MENKVSTTVSAEDATSVNQKLDEIAAILQPLLIALLPEERMSLPKMNNKTFTFVSKTLDYCQTTPEFAPPYLDKQGLADDMQLVDQLMEFQRKVKQLFDGLDDTVMQAGAESFMAALGYYNSVKQASKMNIPGAKAIYEDLKQRFDK